MRFVPQWTFGLCSVLLAVVTLTGSPSAAMTAEEIDSAITKGQQAKAEKDVLGAIKLGRNKPAGQYMLELFVDPYTRKKEYAYFATTCGMWVPWMAHVAQQDNAVLDREFIDEWCLDKDWVAIAVVPEGEGATAARVALGRVPLDNAPVTGLELQVDGKRISPVDDSHFSEFGEGTALLYFERSALRNAQDVVVSATIKDKPVAVKFKKNKLDQILR